MTDDGGDGTGVGPPRLTRRRVLSALGAGVAGGLAGCTNEGTDIVDSPEVFGHQFPYAAEHVQLNPWAPSYPYQFYSILFEAQSLQTNDGERRLGDLIEAVDVDGSTVTLSYSDAFTWWNGEPVTARDQWIAERIQRHIGTRTEPTAELVDEYTLRYEFGTDLARPLVLARVLGDAHNTPAWLFEQWVDRFDEATTADERDSVLEELRGWRLSLEDAAEQGLGCGPYELTEVSMNRLMLERYDDHPRADDIDVPRLWFPVTQEQTGDNLVSKGWLDGGRGLVADRKGTPPAYVEQLAEFQATSGTKLVLDWRNRHLAKRGVRRAIACALPTEDVVANGSWGDPTSTQTGLAGPAARRWLDDDLRSQLRDYPVHADRERAAEHMRAAGYERGNGGNWRDQDGDQPYIRLRTPIWQGWASSGQLIASSLRQFGFDVDYEQFPNRSLFAYVQERNYDALLWWSDGDPYRVYDVTSAAPGTVAYDVDDPDAATSVHGKPVEATVPSTPGDVDAPAADRETVNLVEEWRRIQRPTSEERTAEAVETFATWWNATLPDVDLATLVSGVWGNTRDFDWPDDPELLRTAGPENRPEFFLLKQGLIDPSAADD